jgi:hypothetical protein
VRSLGISVAGAVGTTGESFEGTDVRIPGPGRRGIVGSDDGTNVGVDSPTPLGSWDGVREKSRSKGASVVKKGGRMDGTELGRFGSGRRRIVGSGDRFGEKIGAIPSLGDRDG